MKSSYDDIVESLELRTVLEQKFSQMNIDNDEAPAELKKEVFNTLNSMILVGDILDLFTIKFAQTELTFLDPDSHEEMEDIDDKEAE